MFIGQPFDSDSRQEIDRLTSEAELANVQIYALTLPLLDNSFVSESFHFSGFGSQWYRDGYQASIELTRAVPALRRVAQDTSHTDPFSLLTVATGGFVLHFRRQKQLENAVIALGDALRSRYFLNYTPVPHDPGSHLIHVSVTLPDEIVYARPGYQVPFR